MSKTTEQTVGSVVSLWRYPVKSMMGEELNAADLGARGVVGDRAFAVVDRVDGKVASAKNPRKWPRMFEFRAAFVDVPHAGAPMPPVRITLPDGSILLSDAAGVDKALSDVLARDVRLDVADQDQQEAVESSPRNPTPTAEEYWPDMEGLDYRDTVTEFELPEGTFFDCAVVHVLTTATLTRLRHLYPQGRFEVRRFRPNVVVETSEPADDFAENSWVGRTVGLGSDVRLKVDGPCPRCVMTTLAQGDLPKDAGILRTAARHNSVNVGVYASVVHGGHVQRGDAVTIG